MDLLTLTAIAEQLNISESTVRYYARKFAKVLPSIGEGRQKRYRPEAVDVLRIIAEMFKENRTSTDIFDYLSKRFPINSEIQTEPQQSTLAVQQQSSLIDNQVVTVLLRKITEAMDIINIQHKEIVQAKDKELEAAKENITAQAQELATVKGALEKNGSELEQTRATLAKANSDLQRLVSYKQDAEQKAVTLLDQGAALERREHELRELRTENERLKQLRWWERLFRRG